MFVHRFLPSVEMTTLYLCRGVNDRQESCRLTPFHLKISNNKAFGYFCCSMIINVSSLQELPQAALQLIEFAAGEKVFIFQGDMGAGKTTFIKAIGEALGIEEAITSPTFAIVNEYKSAGKKLYHFDFYRLKTPTEALDMGAEEYFYSGNYCFIEWPEKIPDMLPQHYVSINIEVSGDGARQISVEKV